MGVFDTLLGAGIRKTHEPPIVRQPAAALPRPIATPAVNPTAGTAPVKVAAAAADETRDETRDDPLLRTRVEKYGGAVAPLAAEAGVPVKAHLRGKPTVAEERKPATLDAIVAEYRKMVRMETRRHLYLGSLVDEYLALQPDRSPREQLPRAAAMIVIADRIQSEGLAAVARPHRDLQCFRAARMLGGDVRIAGHRRHLPLSAAG